jgi:hypothetical protein
MYEINSTDVILSIIFTWVIGLTPPLLIRYTFVKHPIAKWPAIGICAFFWVCNITLFIALGSKSKSHTVLLLIAWISYWILRKENKIQKPNSVQADPIPPPLPLQETLEARNKYGSSIDKKLTELKSLHEKGLVTDEVYKERQREILREK